MVACTAKGEEREGGGIPLDGLCVALILLQQH